MINAGKTLWIIILFFLFNSPLKSEDCPMQQEHSSRTNDESCSLHGQHRSNVVMGFDQDKTYHHFKLQKDGRVD